MLKIIKTGLLGAAVLSMSMAVTTTAQAEEEAVLNVYNWAEYISEATIPRFEEETGIKIKYDMFDSNEVLEAKLLTGNTGYDVVVPTANFMARQIQAGVFMELDRSKLSNYDNLDKTLMENLTKMDPGNKHSVPYMWGTTGLGYNVDMIKERLGDDAPVNSWDLLFKEEYVSKLADCGVVMLDTPAEGIPAALNYLGKDPRSLDVADYNNEAVDLLISIRPHIRYFHSSQYMNDLASGEICLAMGWSGDVLNAAYNASEAGNGVNVAYVIPNEGAALWFDMLAIPVDASHPDNAHKFLNYLMRPEVIAEITNDMSFANGNSAADSFVDDEIRNNPGIYPTEAASKKLWSQVITTPAVDRASSRSWTRIKTGS